MLDFKKIMDILPEKGRITLTFVRGKNGEMAMVYAPFYDGLRDDDQKVVNVPIPFMGTPDRLQRMASERISEVSKESVEFVAVAGTKKEIPAPTRVERIRQATERKRRGPGNVRVVSEKSMGGSCKEGQHRGRTPSAISTGLSEEEKKLIPKLPKAIGDVIRKRFIEKATLQAIGDSFGKTKEWARQHVVKGRIMLRALASNPELKSFEMSKAPSGQKEAGEAVHSEGVPEIICGGCNKTYLSTTKAEEGDKASFCPYCSHTNSVEPRDEIIQPKKRQGRPAKADKTKEAK
jgi:hypothetical protein